MKSWRQFVSESNATTAMPFAIACLSAGQTASGSLPAITMPAAFDWIAAWMAGCCAAAVSCVPKTRPACLRCGQRELAAAVGDHLVRIQRVLRDEVERLAGLQTARRARRRPQPWRPTPRRASAPTRRTASVFFDICHVLSLWGQKRASVSPADARGRLKPSWSSLLLSQPASGSSRVGGGDAAVDVDDVAGGLGGPRARRRRRSPRPRPRGRR